MPQTQVSLVDAYLRRLNAIDRAQLTQQMYRRLLSRLNDFLAETYKLPLAPESAGAIKGYMLEDFYQQVYSGLSPQTRNTYVTILKGFFQWVRDAGYAESDPSRILAKVHVPRNDAQNPEAISAKLISPEAMETMVNDPKGYHRLRNIAILETLAGTGLRCEEVTRLNVGTIRHRTPKDLIYVLRKGGKWRWVPISRKALAAIGDYIETRKEETLADDCPLFLSAMGNRMSRKALYNVVASRQKRAGIPTGVHNFRYTVLNRVERTADPVVAMRIAGHDSLQTTAGYMRVTPEEMRAAINRQ